MSASELVAALKEHIAYCPQTGVCVWLKTTTNRVKPGMAVGTINSLGYLCTSFRGRKLGVHRVAYALHHGVWPADDIDHKNGNRQDNRIENLRCVPHAVNTQNLRAAKSNNACGLLGVSQRKGSGRWTARIAIDGRYQSLGTFAAKELASAAYLAAKRKHHIGNTL